MMFLGDHGCEPRSAAEPTLEQCMRRRCRGASTQRRQRAGSATASVRRRARRWQWCSSRQVAHRPWCEVRRRRQCSTVRQSPVAAACLGMDRHGRACGGARCRDMSGQPLQRGCLHIFMIFAAGQHVVCMVPGVAMAGRRDSAGAAPCRTMWQAAIVAVLAQT